MTEFLREINQGIWKLVKTICGSSAKEQALLTTIAGLLTQLVQNSAPMTLPPNENFVAQTTGQTFSLTAPISVTTRYEVFRNGQYLIPGIDYSKSGNSFTLLYPIGDSTGSEPDGENIAVVFLAS